MVYLVATHCYGEDNILLQFSTCYVKVEPGNTTFIV